MIKFSDIEDEFFFVSSDSYGMHTALLNKDTGQLYYRSEMGDLDEIEDADIDWNNCIAIPHKNDLGLGQELVFEFVKNHLVDEYDRVRQIFKKVEPMANSRIYRNRKACFKPGMISKTNKMNGHFENGVKSTG
jgi:hypothetical protein